MSFIRIRFILLFLIISNKKVTAQLNFDTCRLKCQYELTWLSDTLKQTHKNDLLILQIGNHSSKCFSYYTFQSDSIRNLPNGREVWRTLFRKAVKEARGGIPSGFPYARMRTKVYKNYPKGKMTVTDGISLQNFIYDEELVPQQWEIKSDTVHILDYVCQKAVCNFRSRSFIAWFTTEIPINDGPWKFFGLPGLIMRVYDKNRQYHFSITGIEKRNEPIVFNKTFQNNGEYTNTERKKFLKARKRYLKNTSGYVKAETGINLGGEPNMLRYDFLERDYE